MMEPIRAVLSIVFVFGLLAAALFVLSRRGLVMPVLNQRRANRRLEVLESLRISPSAIIVLLRVDSETLAVAVQPSGCTVLKHIREPGHELS
jgi:flagellar biogenesis protein FliO